MKEFIKGMMGLGITAALADRENFVKNVSGIVQEYQDDPEKAEKWAKVIVNYMQGVRDNMNVQSAVKSTLADGLPDKEQINELTEAIKELSKQMKEKK